MKYIVKVKKMPEDRVLVSFSSENLITDIRNLLTVDTGKVRGIYFYVYTYEPVSTRKLLLSICLDDIKTYAEKKSRYMSVLKRFEDLRKDVEELEDILNKAWKKVEELTWTH